MMNESRDEVRAARFDTTNSAVNRRRDDHVVDRRSVGELNPWRVAVAGPHRAFVSKIAKLNTKSPPVPGGRSASRKCGGDVTLLNRIESLARDSSGQLHSPGDRHAVGHQGDG